MVLFMEDGYLQHDSDTNGFVSTGSSANCYWHWTWLCLWPSLWDLGAMFFGFWLGNEMPFFSGVIAKLSSS